MCETKEGRRQESLSCSYLRLFLSSRRGFFPSYLQARDGKREKSPKDYVQSLYVSSLPNLPSSSFYVTGERASFEWSRGERCPGGGKLFFFFLRPFTSPSHSLCCSGIFISTPSVQQARKELFAWSRIHHHKIWIQQHENVEKVLLR
jgi:hypothetical protein